MTDSKLAAALVKAQKEFSPVLKNANNPFYSKNGNNVKYANLADCVEAVLDALNNNGIALIQTTKTCEPIINFTPDSDVKSEKKPFVFAGVIVKTIFLHESGEQMDCGELFIPSTKPDAQGYGSALTYARRYSLLAACGIAPEDDDGNEACKPHQMAKPVNNIAPKATAPTPSINTSMKAAWLKNLADAENIEDLKNLFKDAWKYATALGDSDYLSEIKTVYDFNKERLSK